MDLKKLYVFGDSFAVSTGIGKDTLDGFHNYGDKYDKYTWDKLLASKLQVAIENHGVGGNSNQATLFTLNANLQSIVDQKSVVIIGLTVPERILHIHDVDRQDFGALTITSTLASEYLKRKRNNDLDFLPFLSKSEVIHLMEYYFSLFPNNEKSQWNYYSYSAVQTQNLLHKLGHICVIWDYTLWREFETIKEWSQDKVHDFHWSPNGLIAFADFMDYCIQNRIPYAGIDKLYDWKKQYSSKPGIKFSI